MAETDYDFQSLKEKITNLVSDLEDISIQTKSYSETSKTLAELAKSMDNTSKLLSSLIERSDDVFQRVNDVTVRDTLDSFRSSAESFSTHASIISEDVLKTRQELISENKVIAGKALEEAKTTSQEAVTQVKQTLELFSSEINQRTAEQYNLVAGLEKKTEDCINELKQLNQESSRKSAQALATFSEEADRKIAAQQEATKQTKQIVSNFEGILTESLAAQKNALDTSEKNIEKIVSSVNTTTHDAISQFDRKLINLETSLNTKIMIMGALSVVCSAIAIFLHFI